MMTEKDFTSVYLMLKSLRLPGMAAKFKELHEDPYSDSLSSDDKIRILVEAEKESRNTRKFNRLLQGARLRYPSATVNLKLLESEGANKGLIERLSSGEWISEGKNLLITGKTGAGKSYAGCAFGVGAVSNFKTVLYIRAAELLRQLQSAEDSRTLTEEINRLAKLDLLIIDDFGMMKMDIDMCQHLFELIDTRDGRKATIVISQYPVARWYKMFGNSTYADACLDRLTGGAYRLEFNGDSLRRDENGGE